MTPDLESTGISYMKQTPKMVIPVSLDDILPDDSGSADHCDLIHEADS